MGQIAEDMLDGSCCQNCGCYFKHPEDGIYVHDVPVTCWDCWKDMTKQERLLVIKADVETF